MDVVSHEHNISLAVSGAATRIRTQAGVTPPPTHLSLATGSSLNHFHITINVKDEDTNKFKMNKDCCWFQYKIKLHNCRDLQQRSAEKTSHERYEGHVQLTLGDTAQSVHGAAFRRCSGSLWRGRSHDVQVLEVWCGPREGCLLQHSWGFREVACLSHTQQFLYTHFHTSPKNCL